MKLRYKQSEKSPERSFMARQETLPCIDHDWHFHPEIELIYFMKSTGTRYVGNSIGSFGPGELYLIGSNVPHLFRNEIEYYHNEAAEEAVDLIVVKFEPTFLGAPFLALAEVQKIDLLFQRALKGLKFSKSITYLVHQHILGLVESVGLSSIIGLLKILDILSVSEHYSTLCTEAITSTFRRGEKEKMAEVLNYLTKHFQEKIRLEEIANVAHMTPNSFCRYFRNRTKKSFSQYLTEIRIRHACRLLIEGEKQISDICFESGFNTFTNFNRQFKNLMACTPTEYMRKYQLDLGVV